MKAGDYRDRVEWLQRTVVASDGFGERTATFPSQGFLWCAIEDIGANRESKKEGEKQVSTATVRIRNRPAVAAGDKLVGVLATMLVKTVTREPSGNELSCEVEW